MCVCVSVGGVRACVHVLIHPTTSSPTYTHTHTKKNFTCKYGEWLPLVVKGTAPGSMWCADSTLGEAEEDSGRPPPPPPLPCGGTISTSREESKLVKGDRTLARPAALREELLLALDRLCRWPAPEPPPPSRYPYPYPYSGSRPSP